MREGTAVVRFNDAVSTLQTPYSDPARVDRRNAFIIKPHIVRRPLTIQILRDGALWATWTKHGTADDAIRWATDQLLARQRLGALPPGQFTAHVKANP